MEAKQGGKINQNKKKNEGGEEKKKKQPKQTETPNQEKELT